MQRGRPRHDDVLTPREWEVLGLIREGLTNEQIAERLDVSLSTAKFHVSEIMGKLGVESRQEAAAWQGRPRRVHALSALVLRAGVLRFVGVSLLVAAAVVVVALALGVVLMDTRSSISQTGSPSTPSLEGGTSVIDYTPSVTPTRRVGGFCVVPSVFLSREDARRCGTDIGTRDPCFGPVGAREVICPSGPPGSQTAIAVVLEVPLAPIDPPQRTQEVIDAQAWWVETADGAMCGFNPYGTAPVVNGLRMDFWCDDDTALIGLPTPGHVWTARQVAFPEDFEPVPPGTVVPETIVELKTVWR